MNNSHQIGDITETLQAFEDTRASLTAFASLLDNALFQAGGDLKKDSYGIARLFDRQLEDLEEIENQLRSWNRQADKPDADADQKAASPQSTERVDPTDIMSISRLAGVHESAAARVMFILTGSDFAGDAYKREGDFGTYKLKQHLLERRVYDVLNSGVEWGRVSLETGLDLDTVKSVFLSMLNSPGVEVIPQPSPNAREELLKHIGTDDLHRVAIKLGLDETTVYNVIVSLAIPDSSAELEGETRQIDQQRPANLRKEFIADKLKEGVDASQIAQALNLKRTTVEKVIGQLMAGQPSTDPEDGQQAANV